MSFQHTVLLQAVRERNQSAESLSAALSCVDQWDQFLQLAELYGVAVWLNDGISRWGISIPKPALLALKALSIRHSAAADARYALMVQLSDAFLQAGIPFAALKGVALAPMVYARDALRPMRDIDILVPSGEQQRAGQLLQSIGFDLPEQQPTKYMRDSHQLPNATKVVNGFTISVEVHHDGLSRDVPEHLYYQDVASQLQTVRWRELEFLTLGHEHMLHQVARHLAGLHPGAVLKLVNVLDVVLYAEKYRAEIDWSIIQQQYSHVLNTLKCLHYIVPLSAELRAAIGGVSVTPVSGVGETAKSLSQVFAANLAFRNRLAMLLMPPDWWMHMYYNVDPESSLLPAKLFRHPMRLLSWFWKRLYSRLLGG